MNKYIGKIEGYFGRQGTFEIESSTKEAKVGILKKQVKNNCMFPMD